MRLNLLFVVVGDEVRGHCRGSLPVCRANSYAAGLLVVWWWQLWGEQLLQPSLVPPVLQQCDGTVPTVAVATGSVTACLFCCWPPSCCCRLRNMRGWERCRRWFKGRQLPSQQQGSNLQGADRRACSLIPSRPLTAYRAAWTCALP